MARKQTPPPDAHGLPRGCLVVSATWGSFIVWLAIVHRLWLLAILAVPSILICLWWLHGFILLMKARFRWQLRGIRGVLVYSNSPVWSEYIEANWVARLENLFVMLNWSERKEWRSSLEVSMFEYFCGREENFNPAVILLRGLRQPLVFRFHYAFRDAKHGNLRALEKLEGRLFTELGMEYGGCSYCPASSS